MQCDKCSSREAVVHLTQVADNEMRTFHLCERCAEEKGVEPTSAGPAPLTDFLAQMGDAVPSGTSASGPCPSCELTLSDFRSTGRLGCAECYAHFGRHIRGLLRKLHGGTQHVGKVYAAPETTSADRAARMASLRRSLQHAIDSEDFERAATLRDQIRQMEVAH